MSSLTSWNMSIPEKGGGEGGGGLNTAESHLRGYISCAIVDGVFWNFFGIFFIVFFVFLFFTNLTPEVKKIVFCCCCCRRRLHKVLSFFSPLFLLQNEKTRNHEK